MPDIAKFLQNLQNPQKRAEMAQMLEQLGYPPPPEDLDPVQVLLQLGAVPAQAIGTQVLNPVQMRNPVQGDLAALIAGALEPQPQPNSQEFLAQMMQMLGRGQ